MLDELYQDVRSAKHKIAGTSSVICSSVKIKQYSDLINISVEYRDLQESVVPKMQINLSTFSGLRIFFPWNMNFIF